MPASRAFCWEKKTGNSARMALTRGNLETTAALVPSGLMLQSLDSIVFWFWAGGKVERVTPLRLVLATQRASSAGRLRRRGVCRALERNFW
jgi:hypothetical protein